MASLLTTPPSESGPLDGSDADGCSRTGPGSRSPALVIRIEEGKIIGKRSCNKGNKDDMLPLAGQGVLPSSDVQRTGKVDEGRG